MGVIVLVPGAGILIRVSENCLPVHHRKPAKASETRIKLMATLGFKMGCAR
jgi:hypothetical protein